MTRNHRVRGPRTAPNMMLGQHPAKPITFQVSNLVAHVAIWLAREAGWDYHMDEDSADQAAADLLRALGIAPLDNDGNLYQGAEADR
ncbi:hypothetical protein HDA40_006114 [Hamadaea flava]|uniref:Uncharacterized protein n=1 Tax=Hamadaea flava TaxID=1742688 RepID=A0ABV8LVV6_9ACTN|nr:hypothetical protein [Hamadaea flava]MCP2327607.1 hypothetical protein [Hamadaea flava]